MELEIIIIAMPLSNRKYVVNHCIRNEMPKTDKVQFRIVKKKKY